MGRGRWGGRPEGVGGRGVERVGEGGGDSEGHRESALEREREGWRPWRGGPAGGWGERENKREIGVEGGAHGD